MIVTVGDHVVEWTLARLTHGLCFDNPYGVGIMKDEEIAIGIVYDNYRPAAETISLSIAVGDRKSCNREIVRNIFNYPFNKLGCRRISNVVDSNNVESLELTSRLGYKLEGIMRKASITGADLHIFGMLREECKWIN